MCKKVEVRTMTGVRVLSSVLRRRARVGGVGAVRNEDVFL